MSYHLKFDARYGFAVGRVRVMEKQLLNRQMIDRLIQASSADETGRILAEAGYGKDGGVAASWEEVEAWIDWEWYSVMELICQLSQDSAWTDLFRKRIDFHNLRVILRESATDNTVEGLLREGGLTATETIRNAVQSEKEAYLPSLLQQIVDYFVELTEEERNFQIIDSLIDQAEFREWQDILEQYPNAFLKSWRMLESDLLNLRSFFRLKVSAYQQILLEQLIVPGGSFDLELFKKLFNEPWDVILRVTGRTQYGELAAQAVNHIDAGRPFYGWERTCQKIRLDFIHPARSCGFGIEVLCAYLILKELEIFTVRRIAVGHSNNFSREMIREGLPEHAFV